MTLVSQMSFNGGELSPQVRFRVDQDKYHSSAMVLRNFIPLVQGPIQRRPGLEWMGEVKDSSKNVRLMPFVFNEDQAYVLEIGDLYIRIWFNGELLLSGGLDSDPIEIVTPYTKDQIYDLGFTQSADVLFLCHVDHKPMRLERRGHVDWRLVELIVGSTQTPPTTITHKVVGGEGRFYGYVVTAVNDDTIEESVPSLSVTASANKALNTENFVILNFDSVPGSTLYNIYKDRENSGVYGYIGSSIPNQEGKCTFTDRGASPDLDSRPPKQRNPFDSDGNYPGDVTFYEQRLCFAGTKNKPQTVFMSQSANFNNFNISDPVKNDDSITATLASGQVNRIVWLYGSRRLQVGTIGSEWIMSGVDEGPITPASIDARSIGALGSIKVHPLYISGQTLFVQSDGHTIRELKYEYVSDSFIPSDKTVFSEHLFSGKRIIDWAYQKSPYSIIWIVLNDGSMVGYSYNLEHQVDGFHRHDTDGFVESVCSVPYDTWDDVYFVIRRTINGVEKRYIERMRPYDINHEVEDGFYVDCGVTVNADDEKTIGKITGLDHLEGKEVSLLINGYSEPKITVTNGEVELPYEAEKVTIGLPVESDLVPLTNESNPQTGGRVSLLSPRTINAIMAYFYRTCGGLYGPYTEGEPVDESVMYEIISLRGDEIGTLGSAKVTTDTVNFTIPNNYNSRQTVILRQDEPLPMNIFSLVTNVEVGTQ